MRSRIEHYIDNDQFGFRKFTGTKMAIAATRILGDCSIEHNQNICVCFVNYEKVFDRVKWPKLLAALKDVGID